MLEFARLRRFRVGCHNTAEWAEAGCPRVGSRRAQEVRVRGPLGRAATALGGPGSLARARAGKLVDAPLSLALAPVSCSQTTITT